MASEIDICNLALSHLGDSATIACIDPPEGSAQAEHCARFYPIARDSLLELHDWNFATRRSTLSLLSSTVSPWEYVYAKPSLLKKIIAVVSPDADDYYSTPATYDTTYTGYLLLSDSCGVYVPQPYAIETLSDGTGVICTNLENAVLRYTVSAVDPAVFSALFVITLSWHLASMLAGPIIKGDAGATEAKRCLAMMNAYLSEARTSDANQQKQSVSHYVPWLSVR